MREIVADGRFQFADIPEGAASNAALGEQAEETLDLIQPTGTGGCEMQMITGPPRKPPLYFGHLLERVDEAVPENFDIHLDEVIVRSFLIRSRNAGGA
jgi:hypothetical protein